jgi:hypothetical protein
VSAQSKSDKVDIEVGPELKESKKLTITDIIAYDNTGFYALKVNMQLFGAKNSIVLEHYNKNLSRSLSVALDLKYKKKNKNFELFFYLDDVLYLFTSFPDKKIKRNLLFVESINKETLRPNNDIKKIAEIDFSEGSKKNSGSFSFELSRDSSKVLIYHGLPYEDGEKKRIELHVFDNTINPLWEKKITLPKEDELIDVEDIEVDNLGNVYLLSLDFKEKRKSKRKGKPNYNYEIISYYEKGDEKKIFPVKIEGKFLTDMQIEVNDDGDIICGGFYSEESTFSIIGSYFLKIDTKTKEIKHKTFKEFGIDFITQNMTEKEEKKTKKKDAKDKNVELYNYDLDNIILRDDGGAVLIGEQYFISEQTRTSTDANGNSHTTTYYVYHYNEIIVVSLTPQGNIDWNIKIPKRQVTKSDGGFYSSYALSVVNDKLYFIFNDNPKNLFYKGEGKIYNYNANKESLIVLVELDSSGKLTKESLFSSKEVEIFTRPKVGEQISSDEMILYGQKKKKKQFVRITFLD